MRTTVAAALAALILVAGCAAQPAPAPQEGLTWKCVWVWSVKRVTPDDARAEVARAKSAGFNSIVTEGKPQYIRNVIEEGHRQGIQVLLGHNAVYGEHGWNKLVDVKPPEGCLQEYPPDEVKRLDNPTHPDDVAYKGPWLCIDRPEVRKYAAELAEALVKEFGIDGIAVDFVGYKNKSGCQCDYSRQERAKFAAAHPGMTLQEASKGYSLHSIAAYYADVRKAALKARPFATVAAHIYPFFEPEFYYGNRLRIDYPAQTVAWFFGPHWPIEQVKENCRIVKSTEKMLPGEGEAYAPWMRRPTATGFIGLTLDKKDAKSPERLRREIRAIQEAGLRAICIAGDNFLLDADLTRVMSEELGGTYHLTPPATRPAAPPPAATAPSVTRPAAAPVERN